MPILQVKINGASLYPPARLIGTVSQEWETNLPTELQQFNAFVQAQITVPIYNAGPVGNVLRHRQANAARRGTEGGAWMTVGLQPESACGTDSSVARITRAGN